MPGNRWIFFYSNSLQQGKEGHFERRELLGPGVHHHRQGTSTRQLGLPTGWRRGARLVDYINPITTANMARRSGMILCDSPMLLEANSTAFTISSRLFLCSERAPAIFKKERLSHARMTEKTCLVKGYRF